MRKHRFKLLSHWLDCRRGLARFFALFLAPYFFVACSHTDQTFHLVRSRVAAESADENATAAEELAASIKHQREEAAQLVSEARRREAKRTEVKRTEEKRTEEHSAPATPMPSQSLPPSQSTLKQKH